MGFDLQTNLALKKQNWVELHNKMKKKANVVVRCDWDLELRRVSGQ